MHFNQLSRLFLVLAVALFAMPALAQSAITIGDSVTGSASGTPVVYSIGLEADQTISISLTSDDFDTLVRLQDAMGAEVARDDDGGDGLNSLLVYTAASTSSYSIVVDSFGGSPTGSFTLSISEGDTSGDDMGSTGDFSFEFGQATLPDVREPIAVGQRVEGNTTEVLGYDVALEAGQCYLMQFGSPDGSFDPTLTVFDPALNEVAFNDDGGGNLNALLPYCAAESGTYALMGASFAGTPNGTYALTIDPVQRVALTDANGEALRTPVTGELAASGPTAYTFQAEAGQAALISLTSDDFDTFVAVTDAATGKELASDDDSGEDLNSLLFFQVPSSGSYGIQARSFSSAGAGTFTLDALVGVTELLPFTEPEFNFTPGAASVVPQGSASVGSSINGTLASNTRDGYRIEVAAGTTLTITLTSDAFDAYLRLLDADDVELASDDDSAGSFNSQLTYTFAEGGVYTLVAGSFSDLSSGAYTLTVE